MIPNGTPYINYPPFANNGSKTPPGGSTESAKYALGMIPSDTFPAEWANYLFHGATEGVTRLNADAGSIKKEINNVLSEASITPDAQVNTQLFTAIKALANLTRTIISLTTSASERPAKSDVPFIPGVQDGLRISVKFTNGYYDAATNGFTFNLNNQGAKKIYAAKNGVLTEMQYHELTRDGVQRKWYVQPFTILDLIYDATLDSGVGAWIVEGNPVVLSSSDYVIYADGYNGQQLIPDYANGNILTSNVTSYTCNEDVYVLHLYYNNATVGDIPVLQINGNRVSSADIITGTSISYFAGYVKKDSVLTRSDGGTLFANTTTKIYKLKRY